MFNTSKACFKRPFSKNYYYIETSCLICAASQLAGFCMIRIFTDGSFRIVYTTSGINFSYRQRLYVNRRTKQFVLVAAHYFTDWFLHASHHTMVYFLVLQFCICSVCAEYEKVWTIIYYPQITIYCRTQYTAQKQNLLQRFKNFKNSSVEAFLHILCYQYVIIISFPSIKSRKNIGQSKEVLHT